MTHLVEDIRVSAITINSHLVLLGQAGHLVLMLLLIYVCIIQQTIKFPAMSSRLHSILTV